MPTCAFHHWSTWPWSCLPSVRGTWQCLCILPARRDLPARVPQEMAEPWGWTCSHTHRLAPILPWRRSARRHPTERIYLSICAMRRCTSAAHPHSYCRLCRSVPERWVSCSFPLEGTWDSPRAGSRAAHARAFEQSDDGAVLMPQMCKGSSSLCRTAEGLGETLNLGHLKSTSSFLQNRTG